MSETKLNLYQKLHKIQVEVLGLGKDKKSNNYEYVTGNKVLSHIKPLMNELNLLLKQEILSIENERQDYKTGIGTQYEKDKSEILSKVMMRFTWIDTETGEKDENLFGANGQNDWEKGLGSALTYAERYFLLKFFHIATDEDDIDNPDRKPEDKQKTVAPEPKPTNNKKEDETPVIWLSETQLSQVIEKGIETIKQTLEWYDGKTERTNTKDGRDYKYSMKKDYRTKLEALIK